MSAKITSEPKFNQQCLCNRSILFSKLTFVD